MPEDDCFTPCESELQTAPKMKSDKTVVTSDIKQTAQKPSQFKQKLPIVV